MAKKIDNKFQFLSFYFTQFNITDAAVYYGSIAGNYDRNHLKCRYITGNFWTMINWS